MQLCAQDLVTPEIVLKSPSLLSGERSALAAEVLRRSGRLRLQVRGESMLPAIWPRAVVEIVSCSVEEGKQGEIVLAMRDGRLFVHRLMGRRQDGFVLRGDSMPGSDLVFQDEALIGRVVGGEVAGLNRFYPALIVYRGIGLVLCYCGPLRRAALNLHQRWKKWGQDREAAVGRRVHLEAEC
jgi:Peptidase S24-like